MITVFEYPAPSIFISGNSLKKLWTAASFEGHHNFDFPTQLMSNDTDITNNFVLTLLIKNGVRTLKTQICIKHSVTIDQTIDLSFS